MNKMFCVLLLFLCQASFSQTSDSVSLQIKNLRTDREDLNKKLVRLKAEDAEIRSKLKKLDNRYNGLLVNLDSLTGVSIALEKKKQRTKAEQQKLISIKTNQDSLKESLIAILEQRSPLESKQMELKADLGSLRNSIGFLDEQMQKLEKLRQKNAQ